MKKKLFPLKKIKKYLLWGGFIFVNSWIILIDPSFAKDEDSLDEWKSEQLIDFLLDLSPEVEKSKIQKEQAEDRRQQAKAKFYPNFQMIGSLTTQDKSTSNQIISPVTGAPLNTDSSSQTDSQTTKLNLQQNLFSSFLDMNRLTQRELELKKASYDFKLSSFTQKLVLIKSVHQIASLQTDVENLSEKIKIDKEREKEIRRKYVNRTAKESDLLSIQTTLNSTRIDLANTQADLENQWLNLEKVSNKKINKKKIHLAFEKEIKDSEKENDSNKKNPSNLVFSENLKEQVLLSHPSYLSSKLDYESSEYQMRQVKASLGPSADLNLNYYLSRTGAQQVNNTWDAQLQITFPWPLGFEKKANLAESLKAQEVKKIQKEIISNNISSEIQTLFNTYQQNEELLKLVEEGLALNEKLMSSTKKEYNSGISSLNEFLLASSNYLQTKKSRDRLKIQQMQKIREIKEYTHLIQNQE